MSASEHGVSVAGCDFYDYPLPVATRGTVPASSADALAVAVRVRDHSETGTEACGHRTYTSHSVASADSTRSHRRSSASTKD